MKEKPEVYAHRQPVNGPPNSLRTIWVTAALSLLVGALLAGMAQQIFITSNVVSRSELQQQFNQHETRDEAKTKQLNLVTERQQVVLQRLARLETKVAELVRQVRVLENRH